MTIDFTHKPNVVFYHFPCLDGFASAMAFHLKWPDVNLIPINYGSNTRKTVLDNVIGNNSTIVFADFFPGVETIELLVHGTNRKIIVLDHHKSAEKDARVLFDTGVISGIFDMDRSGAGICWDVLHGTPRPKMINYIEDRDIWKWKYGKVSKFFHTFIASHYFDFNIWEDILNKTEDDTFLQSYLKEGEAIERKHMKDIRELIDNCTQWRKICGHTVPVVNIPYTHGSETGNLLLDIYPYAPFVAYYIDMDGYRKWGFRSEDHRVDVSEIAKLLGGGGHKNASGAELPFDSELIVQVTE